MTDKSSEVNKEARKERQRKLFYLEGSNALNKIKCHILLFLKNKHFLQSRLFGTGQSELAGEIQPEYQQKQITRRIVLISILVLVISSFKSYTGYTYYPENEGTYWGFEGDYEDPYLTAFITDEEGYLLKAVPNVQEGATYLDRQDLIVVHEVQENQTLSQIASMYGLELKTLLWANDISDPNRLKLGVKLKIPKTDGILYKVKTGETVDVIASRYKIDSTKVREYNNIQNDIIQIGQILVLPDAKPIIIQAPRIIAQNPTRPVQKAATGGGAKTVETDSGTVSELPSVTNVPVATGGKMTFPTTGKITQGYHKYHLAIDVSERSMPSIWSAKAGTVKLAAYSGWNGGYGKYVIVDHGNGLQTLYAHMNKVYVTEGQSVSEGQVLGQMGNTGRVYGVTGIHLHFEVRQDGARMNPWNYL
ncbi:MAG: Peptidase M23 family protein [Candidatus Peregrinibacteria bacterium GW2011_GWA2_33_10]|nr:MAG: Peptidase M23 family protein [Candidatus Peregrinibacteria bacterium GW2011_GWA2_33_10]OGJ49262.1 MAG: hypothetical protein A2229_05670 [Candidatus Peregrinibacteria bacterium RIFOXYA2_FULL_33_7]